MEEKKIYIKPEIEVIEITDDFIITTSEWNWEKPDVELD